MKLKEVLYDKQNLLNVIIWVLKIVERMTCLRVTILIRLRNQKTNSVNLLLKYMKRTFKFLIIDPKKTDRRLNYVERTFKILPLNLTKLTED